MRLAVISDLHLGDRTTRLLKEGQLSETYEQFKDAVLEFSSGKPLDFLVLNGDVLDFSISSFEESCRIARAFFVALARDGIAEQLIYIPGNHDKHIWDAVEWETNVIRKLKAHEDPRAFRRTQPGVVDLKEGSIVLTGVSKTPEGRYGTLFIEGLFEVDRVLPVNIVYPNLYLKGQDETIVVTHGHMLELAWVLLSELLSGEPELARKIGLFELEEYNIPVTSAICTGVGQAGAVSKLFYRIQQEVKRGKKDRLKSLLDSVLPRLDRLIELPWLAEIFDDAFLLAIRMAALYMAGEVKDSRYDEKFFERRSVRKRFYNFYGATFSQVEVLKLPLPRRIIFGHTHEPIPESNPMVVEDISLLKGEPLYLYNTGGWLDTPGKSAEVFFVDENGISKSINI